MTVMAILESGSVSNLQMEYKHQQDLFDSQPSQTRLFLEGQDRIIAQNLLKESKRVQFQLPEFILPVGEKTPRPVSKSQRNHIVSGNDLCGNFLRKLTQLEHSADPSISLSASLIRFSTANTILHQFLPDGKNVRYRTEVWGEIPSQPYESVPDPIGRLEKTDQAPVPFTPYALRFFLPQWVAFNEKDQLLTPNLQEAETCLHSMQKYLSLLGQSVTLNPYIVADEAYQRKRSGILGQLINQGRAFGRYVTRMIVKGIKQRVQEESLNRGVSLDIDYFDDQKLSIVSYHMKIIPHGRVMFLPAFMVLASRKEASRITGDPILNSSTRKHLLSLMAIIEQEFLPKKESI